MAKTQSKIYSRRYIRDENPQRMQFTERDLDILKFLGRFRLVNNEHFYALFPSSKKAVERRLRLLFHNSYLVRPPAQQEYYKTGGGSNPMVTSLDSKGFALLKERGAYVAFKSVRQSGHIKIRHIRHELLVTSFAVRLILSVAQHGCITLFGDFFLQKRLPDAQKSKARPFQIAARIRLDSGQREQKVEPDYSFLLRLETSANKTLYQLYLVEIDIGVRSMPVERSDLKDQSSIIKKMFVYDAYKRANSCVEGFGVNSFRVLIVTSSQTRIKTMQAALHKYHLSPGLFWFTTHDSLEGLDSDITGHKFQDGNGDVKTLGFRTD